MGGHICDFKHHILMHTVLSVYIEHTKENTILSTLVDALADTGSYNSSLGTLKLWVFFQLSPISLNWDDVGL